MGDDDEIRKIRRKGGDSMMAAGDANPGPQLTPLFGGGEVSVEVDESRDDGDGSESVGSHEKKGAMVDYLKG